MKPTVDTKLDEFLGLESAPESLEVSTLPAPIESSGNPDKDMQDDFALVRGGIRDLIGKSTELVENANFFAKERQDARSVEAAALATKEARENLMALMGLHKTRKDIEQVSSVSPGGDTTITNNAVFVGTTGDLLKLSKEMNASGGLKDALKTIDVLPAIAGPEK